ncbi:MAG: PleD family two-component system response regulator [Elusimicrobiota bacterium]
MLGLLGGGSKRAKPLVLVVDDDDGIREMLVDILHAMGVDAIDASNGPDGIKLALKMIPDLVLLDVRMPMMDGFDACHAIKSDAKGKSIPILMVTSMDQFKDVEKALAHGADGHIAKPLNHANFKKKISDVLKLPSNPD